MAIVRGNNAGNTGNGANLTWNHNCISDTAGILVVFTSATIGDITAVTYGGQVMTLEQEYASASGEISLWYLVGPPIGVNAVLCTNAAPQAASGISVDYNGVDQLAPFGVVQGLHTTLANSGPALLDEVLATEAGWMCVDGAYNGRNANNPRDMTEGAGQANLGEQSFWDAANNSGKLEVSEELSTGLTTTMSWTLAALTDHWGQLAAPLRPHIPFSGRLIEYTFDVWDPLQRLIGRDGHAVNPNEVRADKWGKLLGFRSPSSKTYATLAEGPDNFYISGVTSDGETVRITPDEQGFADMILKRLTRG